MNRDELQDLACERLGDALGELMLAAYEQDKHDPEYRKFILREHNTLLKEIGCEYARIPSRLLDEPAALCAYIQGNLDYPAQNRFPPDGQEAGARRWSSPASPD